MKKFLTKSCLFLFLLLLTLEGLIRLLHLYTEDPPRMIDELLVEKRVPGHKGYAVTGNRWMNFSEFNINKNGFNSHRDFSPSKTEFEIALIGDSFIEGFHTDFQNSIGVKIENYFNNTVKVYEYGYAGYDLADQYHLIEAYQNDFDKIEIIVVYLDYPSDLLRDHYKPNYDRISLLSSPLFKIRDNVKLLAYLSKIGFLDKILELTGQNKTKNKAKSRAQAASVSNRDLQYLENFKKLSIAHGIDYSKTFILLDKRKTSKVFLEYCDSNNVRTIDFGETFAREQKPITLIYDQHWNDHGRSLIARLIGKELEKSTIDRNHFSNNQLPMQRASSPVE